MDYHFYGDVPSDEQENQLREYAKSKDLSVRKIKATMRYCIFDTQTRRQVAKNLTFEEAYEFVNNYAW